MEYGTIRSPARLTNAERIVGTYAQTQALIKKLKPDRVSIEKLFFFKNAKTVIAVAEMRGVLTLAARQAGLPVFEYTPLQIKQAVSGYGRADKGQVQRMLQLILHLTVPPRPDDAADALASAICCANSERPG